MTVSSTTTRNSYSGNGSTTTFAYGFKIFADADLTVILRASTGAETVQSLTTNYTVTNAGNASGGNVVFGTAPASGVTVVIRRNMAQTQSTDYTANDPFPAESHEDALDRLTFIAQQQQEEVDRSLKLSRTNTMTSTEFTVGATDRASKVLAFDSSGELSVTQELGTFKGTDATVTTAAYVERDIIKSTTTAELNNVYICVATSVVGDALTDTDHFSLLVDAVSAASSATTATTKATAAASSATAAASSASTASTQASNASTSASTASTQATNAASSATAAQTAQAAAEAALDTFDDRFLGAKSSDPSVDNDGNALIDGALYFDTTNDIMKVYDLTNTQWRQLTLTSTNQTNVNTVAGAISNVNTVAGSISNINTANSNITNIDTVAGISSNVTTVAGISSNVTTVAGISSNVTSVAGNSSNINSAVSNATNINTVAGAVTNVNTVASNISGVNSFADRYRVASSAPSSSLDVGDLYFDTTANELKVYKSSGWAAAGSTVNGTSARFHYDISGTPTSVTGSDAAGNTLAYDAGFIDVYVNGVRMSTADVTVTSGDTVTFASALADGDEVDIVAFGTFAVANIVSTGALNSGSITSGFGNIDTGSSTITTTGVGTFGSLDISGDIDVDGTTNLDVVDIDGAVDMASTLGVAGVVTANAGVVVDNITIDGTEIDLSSGDLTVDVAGDIILDAAGADVFFGAGGNVGSINMAANDFIISSLISDKDMIFKGNDGGSTITALTFDMSASGDATFNNNVTLENMFVAGNITHAGDNNTQISFTTDQVNITAGNENTIQCNYNVVVINEDSADIDLRVESNGNANMFSVDAGNDALGIGINSGAYSDTSTVSFNGTGKDTGIFMNVNGTGTHDFIKFNNGGGNRGEIGTTGSNLVYSTSSDYRLKENVEDMTDAITRLKKLKPKRFSWIIDKKDSADTDGFLAHEVTDVVPDAVVHSKDETTVRKTTVKDALGNVIGNMSKDEWEEKKASGDFASDTTYTEEETVPVYQSVDYSKLVTLLTGSLQEAVSKIETLEASNTALEARITALESA